MTGREIGLSLGVWPEAEWSELIEGYRDLSLLQTWAYGEAKAATGSWRPERGVFARAGKPVGTFQALVRCVPGGGLAWINRAPLWRRADGNAAAEPPVLAAMLVALQREYVEKRGLYLRIAPALGDDEAAKVDFAAAGFTALGTPGWASAALDLAPDLGELRRHLHQKWRNALNKAERAGMEVRAGNDGMVWDDFLALHRRFTASRGEVGVDAGLIVALQACLPHTRRMTALVAYKDGMPAAGALLARYGRCAEYLAGNSTVEGRAAAAGQLLLWRAIEALKHEGIPRLDLGGMDPARTPSGILEFKQRIGGTPYRLAAEIEAGGVGLVGRLVRWRVRRARAVFA